MRGLFRLLIRRKNSLVVRATQSRCGISIMNRYLPHSPTVESLHRSTRIGCSINYNFMHYNIGKSNLSAVSILLRKYATRKFVNPTQQPHLKCFETPKEIVYLLLKGSIHPFAFILQTIFELFLLGCFFYCFENTFFSLSLTSVINRHFIDFTTDNLLKYCL